MSVKELPIIGENFNENQPKKNESRFNLNTDEKFYKKISNDSVDIDSRNKKNSSHYSTPINIRFNQSSIES